MQLLQINNAHDSVHLPTNKVVLKIQNEDPRRPNLENSFDSK